MTIVLTNKRTETSNAIGFHKDGITPSLIGYRENGVEVGPYYTFFSNGFLNCRVSYEAGEYDGDYICYSEDGQIVYKAFYDNGIATSIEVNDTIYFDDEIIMYEE